MNQELFFKVGKVFTPHTAVSKKDLFSGREPQIKSLLRAVSEQGSHAIVFGERGVGKTSLGHIITSYLPRDNSVPFALIGCDTNMTFSSLWNGILGDLSISVKTPPIGFQGEESNKNTPLSSYISNPDGISVQEVRAALAYMPSGAIIIIDELDRLDEKTTTALADTIKTLSDYNVAVTLVLIGVGDSVETLIRGHESIERALIQIHMPRMTIEEVGGVISTGLEALKMSIEDKVKQKIIALSRGLPHYTHLLMFHAGQRAAENDKTNVSEEDFKCAIEQSVTEKEHSLKNNYDLAIQSTKRAYLFRPVLLACALAECDRDGFFASIDVQSPLKSILDKELPLAAFISHIGSFCGDSRGSILERTGTERKYRYRFKNPLMQSFVIMKALKENFPSSTPLEELIIRH